MWWWWWWHTLRTPLLLSLNGSCNIHFILIITNIKIKNTFNETPKGYDHTISHLFLFLLHLLHSRTMAAFVLLTRSLSFPFRSVPLLLLINVVVVPTMSLWLLLPLLLLLPPPPLSCCCMFYYAGATTCFSDAKGESRHLFYYSQFPSFEHLKEQQHRRVKRGRDASSRRRFFLSFSHTSFFWHLNFLSVCVCLCVCVCVPAVISLFYTPKLARRRRRPLLLSAPHSDRKSIKQLVLLSFSNAISTSRASCQFLMKTFPTPFCLNISAVGVF